MFYKLVRRNASRSRKENGLFFSSLIISIIAFYIILSLSHQDIMLFLTKMESDAVNKLLTMVPVFYGLTLVILFFLIYYASKFQLERRRREFGVYLMMGMRRTKLFAMLLAEDFYSSTAALAIGLPVAVLLSELISLVTARWVGLDIIGHQITFSLQAVLWTALGFFVIKLLAFLILSGKISRQEIGSLLVDTPEGAKKQLLPWLYGCAMVLGLTCLIIAYRMAICGTAWVRLQSMGLTLILGLLGTFVTFWGLQFPIGLIAKAEQKGRLHVFNFRQIEETVIRRHSELAVCSLLILAAMCCFGTGIAVAASRGQSRHVLDYTFKSQEGAGTADPVRQSLAEHDLTPYFEDLFEMKVGHIRTTDDYENSYRMESVFSALEQLPPSEDRDILLNNLSYATYPYLISLDSYNQLLQHAGLPTLELEPDEAAVYMGELFVTAERVDLFNSVLAQKPEVTLDETPHHLAGTVQTTNLITDGAITLSFALILPEESFQYYTLGKYDAYLNGVLSPELVQKQGLMNAISYVNEKLDHTSLTYESHLQNMGRQMFYMVASSYITIYLAIIFLLVANTIIGVQFLMGQQKSQKRYKSLIRLGATYEVLCKSARNQINWYFGIPTSVALISSLFGIRGLLTGILPPAVFGQLSQMMVISAAMIFMLCVVECIYIAVVKRSSSRYLLSLMIPDREE